MSGSASSPLGWLGRLNGPQTLGNSRFFWVCFLVVLVALAFLPTYASRFQTITASNIAISAILAMSLCLIWGYGGILSLGQAAFFVIGGYAYGIVGMNLIRAHGNSDLAVLAGIAAPALFAAALGALMFYSRLKGVYVAILTLVVSLLLGLFMRQTADPSYAIGTAALGGMNGLKAAGSGNPGIPNLTLGFGEMVAEFDGRRPGFYWVVLAIGTAVYLGLRLLVNSKHGYVLLSCREDLERTETFGYDVRRIQLMVFSLSAAIAGLAGTLYTAWGTYIHPDGFSVAPNILVVIWVAVGGRKDLTSVVIGTILLSWISLELASYGEISLFVLGLILVVAMLVAPEGIIATLGTWIGRLVHRRRKAEPDPVPARSKGAT